MSFAPTLDDLDLAATEIPVDGWSLAAAVRAHDRFTARLAIAAATFQHSDEWKVTGYTSVAAWLRDQGMTQRDAAVLVRIGQRMAELPATAAAWVEGKLTGGQVHAICAQVIQRHLSLFREHEAELIESFAPLTVDETVEVMAEWRRRADAINEGPGPNPERCEARLSPTLDDRGLLSASLDAEGYGLAVAALGLADSHDLDVPAPERRGQALKDIFRFFLDHQNKKSGGRHRPHINVVVRAETLGTGHADGYDVVTGMTLSPATIERLLCECDMHRVMVSASEILDLGRITKTPSRELFNAIVLRDRHCRFPACDRPALWCHAHHVDWFGRDFGKTSLDNLVLLCERHHGVIHRKGWAARLLASGDFEVTDPTGRIRTTRPPGVTKPPIPDRYVPRAKDVDAFAEHIRRTEGRRYILNRLAAHQAAVA